jgi:phosphopantetheinyl transferase (holo-ACP synthase)
MLHLYGMADQIAKQFGLIEWSVSISHSMSHAVAVAVAIG